MRERSVLAHRVVSGAHAQSPPRTPLDLLRRRHPNLSLRDAGHGAGGGGGRGLPKVWRGLLKRGVWGAREARAHRGRAHNFRSTPEVTKVKPQHVSSPCRRTAATVKFQDQRLAGRVVPAQLRSGGGAIFRTKGSGGGGNSTPSRAARCLNPQPYNTLLSR